MLNKILFLLLGLPVTGLWAQKQDPKIWEFGKKDKTYFWAYKPTASLKNKSGAALPSARKLRLPMFENWAWGAYNPQKAAAFTTNNAPTSPADMPDRGNEKGEKVNFAKSGRMKTIGESPASPSDPTDANIDKTQLQSTLNELQRQLPTAESAERGAMSDFWNKTLRNCPNLSYWKKLDETEARLNKLLAEAAQTQNGATPVSEATVFEITKLTTDKTKLEGEIAEADKKYLSDYKRMQQIRMDLYNLQTQIDTLQKMLK